MDTDIDQQLRDYQREYLDFFDDNVSTFFKVLSTFPILLLSSVK